MAKALEPADARLDPLALLVAFAIVADRPLPIASPGSDWPDGGLARRLAEVLGIVGSISDQTVEPADLRDEVVGGTDVGPLMFKPSCFPLG